MRKTITLFACITLIGMTTITTSCKKKPDIQTIDTTSEIASDGSAEHAGPKAELCVEGNCPCGDGFCAKNSVCIKDKCFCGGFPDKGYIDEGAVASNLYGEFECVRYYFQEGCNEDYSYDFICKREDGCKTGDGRKYPFSDIISGINNLTQITGDDYLNEDMPELHIAFDGNDVAESVNLYLDSNMDEDIENRNKYLPYENVIKEPYLDKCGAKLPENLRYMVRSDLSVLPSELKSVDLEDSGYEIDVSPSYCENYWSRVVAPRDPECKLRKACNDAGVTSDHIMEYACEIGHDSSGYNAPIGLRCIQSGGCTCGDTKCPEHALCKDGACVYDIYYEHRTCPEDGWDAAKSDIDNYVLTSDAKKCSCDGDSYDDECVDNCLAHCMDCDEEDCKESCRIDYNRDNDCYEKCYWDKYESTMTRIDPCK